jgi:chemotaxis protein MotB
MIRVLMMQFGLPAARLSAAGYAEFHPVSSNETPSGRAQNRRLDVVILAPYQPLNQNPDISKPDLSPSSRSPAAGP